MTVGAAVMEVVAATTVDTMIVEGVVHRPRILVGETNFRREPGPGRQNDLPHSLATLAA